MNTSPPAKGHGIRLARECDRYAAHLTSRNAMLDAADLLARCAIALRSQGEPSEQWQPIETAPKDGKAYLFFGKWKGDPYPGKGEPLISLFRWTTLQSSHSAEYQWMGDGFTSMEQWHVEFTHWMPLPQQPETKDGNL